MGSETNLYVYLRNKLTMKNDQTFIAFEQLIKNKDDNLFKNQNLVALLSASKQLIFELFIVAIWACNVKATKSLIRLSPQYSGYNQWVFCQSIIYSSRPYNELNTKHAKRKNLPVKLNYNKNKMFSICVNLLQIKWFNDEYNYCKLFDAIIAYNLISYAKIILYNNITNPIQLLLFVKNSAYITHPVCKTQAYKLILQKIYNQNIIAKIRKKTVQHICEKAIQNNREDILNYLVNEKYITTKQINDEFENYIITTTELYANKTYNIINWCLENEIILKNNINKIALEIICRKKKPQGNIKKSLDKIFSSKKPQEINQLMIL